MGLYVTAYRKLLKLDCVFDGDGQPIEPLTREPIENYFQTYVNSNFPEQAEGIEHKAVYAYDEQKGFPAGSYRGYGAWREILAKLTGYKAVPFEGIEGYKPSEVLSHQVGAFEAAEGPFRELLCFSDCDGVIGAKVAAKLAGDFAEWDERAKSLGDELFYEKYTEWRKCFEMASDNGAVDFH